MPASPTAFRPRFGATVEPGGAATTFTVWAPRAAEACVVLPEREVGLSRAPDGTFGATVDGIGAGIDYRFALDGEEPRPDPASRHQPQGVFGPSRTLDPSRFVWTDAGWRGPPPLRDLVIYELHVGTFSPQGTFDAVIPRLQHLAALGVDAIEVMPIAEFSGGRNWGYDGVQVYAAQSTYGGPEGFARLVDAAHAAGIAVILDVVYNHTGPEGALLAEYGPYFSRRAPTPWGEAINFDGPDSDAVRDYFVENALWWLTHFHVDGLRLDAIDTIVDLGARHVLAELSERFEDQAKRLGRPAYLIAESDLSDPKVIRPRAEHGWGMHAQWADDFHHAVHTLLTGDEGGYLCDFGRPADLKKALQEGFVHDGIPCAWRRRRHGVSAVDRPGEQHVVYIQNHDQVANTSGGVRITGRVGLEAHKLAATLLLTAPNVPMLFMGEEWAEAAPFHYFVSHGDPALCEAVRVGRQRDYLELPGARAAPDPVAEETLLASRLDWTASERSPHREVLALYRALIALRRELPALRSGRKDLTRVVVHDDPPRVAIERADPGSEARVLVLANLGPEPSEIEVPFVAERWRRRLFTSDPAFAGPPDGAGEPPAELSSTAAESARVFLGPRSAAIYLA